MQQRICNTHKILKATLLSPLLFFVMQIQDVVVYAQDTIASPKIKDTATINTPVITQDTAVYLPDTDDTLTISPEFFVINKKGITR